MKADLHRELEDIVSSLGARVSFTVEYPPEGAHADYATNAALAAAKELGKNPKEVAGEIAAKLREAKLPFIEAVEVAGPGFVNITLTRAHFTDVVNRAIAEGEAWGRNASREDSRVIVEYSQPNPFKPFHIGHLMSTTIGESLARLVEFSGAKRSRFNYHGDIGPHVAKGIWGLEKLGLSASNIDDLGKAYVHGATAYEEDEKAKEEIDALNKRLYANDPSLKDVYEEGKKTSLARFAEIYTILGSEFDHVVFESETGPIGLEIVKSAVEKGIFEESDGAIVFKGEKYGLHTRVFITSAGTPTYEAKEIGFAKKKHELFPFDQNITTVAVEQDGFFTVVEKAIDALWPQYQGTYNHVTHGMMQLSGGKMSSRKGNIITGESLIEDMTAEAHERMKESDAKDKDAVAVMVAVAAIKYVVLKQGLGKNIVFDPEKSLSLDGDSGPYLQYAHVRTLSILRKAASENIHADTSTPSDLSRVERLLGRFPEIVLRASESLEPHHITQYITELSSALNSFYAAEKVLDGTDKAPYKLAVMDATRQTLRNGLYLLGIATPEEM